MCGIIRSNFKSKNDLNNIISLLESRGPDNKSSYTINDNYFGHTRLKIIDLSDTLANY